MKRTRGLVNNLVACGIALAMISTLAAQTVAQREARVVRTKGVARYSTGDNIWHRLKVGDLVRSGMIHWPDRPRTACRRVLACRLG
jgi:hypothetical protein